MEHSQDHPLDLKHYGRILWRRKGIVILCTVAVICGTLVAVSNLESEYESDATLLIQDRQPLARELEEVLGGWRQSEGGFRADEERLSRLVGRVRSRPFLERVIKILKMTDDPQIQDAARKEQEQHPEISLDELAIRVAVNSLGSRIRFASVGPGLYRIIVVDRDPTGAQLLAKWISELFVDITIQKELEFIRTAREFGAEQLRVYEEQLRQAELELEQYRGSMIEQQFSNSIIDGGNLQIAESLQRRLSDEVATAEARVPPLSRAMEQQGLGDYPQRLESDASVLAAARRIETTLDGVVKEKLSSTSPDLGVWPPPGTVEISRRDLLREIERVTADAYPDADDSQRRAVVAYVFARLDARIQESVASGLRGHINAYKRQLQSRPTDESEMARMEEEVRKNRELLKSFRAQMVASDVSQAVETTSLGLRIEIIDPAQMPLEPTRPDRVKLVMAAFLVGPLLGFGFGFLTEILDPTLRTLSDIRRVVPEPVFGTVPLLDAIPARRRGLRRHWVPATLAGIVFLTGIYFVARETVLPAVDRPVHMVDPGEAATP